MGTGLAANGWHLVTARGVLTGGDEDRRVSRADLQQRGMAVERQRPGAWLMDAAASAPPPVVVDSAKTRAQVGAAREELRGCVVVHLDVSVATRRARFVRRDDLADRGMRFDALLQSDLEQEADRLGRLADLVVGAERDPDAVLSEVLQQVFRAGQHT